MRAHGNEPFYNSLFQIKEGAEMSLNHLMALILYSDTTDLQRYFKEQARSINDETVKQVLEKVRKFAHWYRLLYEAIWLFGKRLKRGKMVYHGIDFKPMFQKLEYNFNAPLSTTKKRTIA